ncbi:MAG: sensor histidine kinase [Roseiflexaceae bacterium]
MSRSSSCRGRSTARPWRGTSCSRDPKRARQNFIDSGVAYASKGDHKTAIIQFQNALTYAPPPASLMITALQHDTMMVVDIADSGPGIPAEERGRVFEKFYRLPQAQQANVSGAGLGLAICKGLIEAHGGQIRIDARAEGGTVVTLYLPLQIDAFHELGV